jgi:hypothetical protein
VGFDAEAPKPFVPVIAIVDKVSVALLDKTNNPINQQEMRMTANSSKTQGTNLVLGRSLVMIIELSLSEVGLNERKETTTSQEKIP